MAFTNEQLEALLPPHHPERGGGKRPEKASECQGSYHRSRRTWSTGSPLPCSSRCGNNRKIVDGDEVDLSNLQRQVIHTTADVGKLKVESAG